MNADLLFANIDKHVTLRTDEKNHIISCFSCKRLLKKEYLLKQGEACRTISFINQGLLRAFFVSKEGKDSTVMFAIQDWWITDMYCFLQAKPAMVNIQAVESCEILLLSKADLDRLLYEIPKFETFFRILMQNAYCREQLRSIQTLSLSAKERYHRFVAKYPQVAKRVTQKQIASYLGITPEFLSAIRAQKSE